MFSSTNPLEVYQWKKRIILISGAAELIDLQAKRFSESKLDINDRDILVLILDEGFIRNLDKTPLDLGIQEVAEYFQIDLLENFHCLLIGKDGGIKNHWTEPVDPKLVYGLIDQMPMRKREMKKSPRN